MKPSVYSPPHPHDEFYTPPYECGRIVVDAIPHRIIVVHIIGYEIMDALEAKPRDLNRVTNFVRRCRREYPNATLTGADTQRWPPGLYAALALEFGAIEQPARAVMASTSWEFRRSTRMFRFFRATWIAACADQDATRPVSTEFLSQWKVGMLTEVTSQLSQTQYLDDIPF